MIKIIKDGVVPPEQIRIYSIECPICGCVFECEDSDFKSHERCIDGYSTILCPCCKGLIKTKRHKLSSRLEIKKDVK